MVWCPDLVSGVVIVGAGPSGLAVAACLKQLGVPDRIIEKSDSIASLWKNRTYARLKLILPKKFCKLPKLPIPENFPEFLTKHDFILYLENYAKEFDIKPRFNECVNFAEYHEFCKVWRVVTSKKEYWCQMLVVATGENAEPVVPKIDGLDGFSGEVIHSKDYDSGGKYEGKNVLVVGCGNSGCDVSLDLASHNANPFMVVRNSDHELPQTIKGKSTDDLFMMLMKKANFGQRKNYQGKIPVLDDNIREVEINIVPGIKRFNSTSVELVNDKTLDIDYVILATGYRSNVPNWLKETGFFANNGFPITPFPNGWKGKHGLFAAGFTRRGLVGLSSDAERICKDARKEFDDELMWNIYCEECSLGIR